MMSGFGRWMRIAASAVVAGVLAAGLAAGQARLEPGFGTESGAETNPEAGRAPSGPPPAGSGPSLTIPPSRGGPPGGERRFLDANEFRARYENMTVHLLDGDLHYGSEYYMPGDQSIWIAFDGPCQLGDWAYVTPEFCFQYGDSGPHCWTIFDSGGETYAESVDGFLLRIYAVEERPLQCDPELFS